jgi:hypothetical protein
MRIDVKTYNISLINIESPKERNLSNYNSKILYNNNNFNIQSPLCTVIDIDTKSESKYIHMKFNLSSNFNHFQFFSNINELSIEYLKKISKNHKYNILTNKNKTEESIRESFIPTTNKLSDSEMIIKVKLNKSTTYFDKEKTEISGLEIKKNDKVVCILKTNGILVDQNTASLTWICQECLKFK